jgi:hypothetical protein
LAFSGPSAWACDGVRVRVLVVEDDKQLASAMRRGQKAEGYAVDVALTGSARSPGGGSGLGLSIAAVWPSATGVVPNSLEPTLVPPFACCYLRWHSPSETGPDGKPRDVARVSENPFPASAALRLQRSSAPITVRPRRIHGQCCARAAVHRTHSFSAVAAVATACASCHVMSPNGSTLRGPADWR